LREEAELLGRYVLGHTAPTATFQRYSEAVRLLHRDLDDRDERLPAYVRRHPGAIGFVDAGLALLRPGAAVHQRALLMAAILETSPEVADELLSTPSWVAFTFASLRATIR